MEKHRRSFLNLFVVLFFIQACGAAVGQTVIGSFPSMLELGYCEPDPTPFKMIKASDKASPAAELNLDRTMSFHASLGFAMEKMMTRSARNPTFGKPSPFSPNQVPLNFEPGKKFLMDIDGTLWECRLLPCSSGFKIYTADGQLMGLASVGTYTIYGFPRRFPPSGTGPEEGTRQVPFR